MQKPALEDALRQLHILGTIRMDGHITDMGRRMATLHVDLSVASSAWDMKIFDSGSG